MEDILFVVRILQRAGVSLGGAEDSAPGSLHDGPGGDDPAGAGTAPHCGEEAGRQGEKKGT